MANSLWNFLNEFNGKNKSFTKTPVTGGVKDGADKASEHLNQLSIEISELIEVIDREISTIANLEKEIKSLNIKQSKFDSSTKEYSSIDDQIINMRKEVDSSKQSMNEIEKEINDLLKKEASKRGITIDQMKNMVNGLNKSNLGLSGFNKNLDGLSNKQVALKGFHTGMKNILYDFDNLFSAFKAGSFLTNGLFMAFQLVGIQIIDLNDKLVQFGRDTQGTLNYKTIGYDAYGNNKLGVRGSLTSQSLVKSVNEKDVLDSFNAFTQGDGTLGVPQLQDRQQELQDYGLSIAKLNKVYGIQSSQTTALSKVLTQQYGKGIKETSDILSSGAETAKKAGVNVGVFFENMNSLAQLDLYIAGGTKGLEKAAESLTKLGLSAQSLQKLNDSYSGFTELIERQQRAVATGMSNLGSVQERVFAKIQLGDTEGAQELRLSSAATDIINRGLIDSFGKINQQGRNLLKANDFAPDEILKLEQLNKKAKDLGISLDDVVKSNYKDEATKRRAAQYDQEQLKVKEKLMQMWGRLREAVIDPLAAAVVPIFDLAINVLGGAFKGLAVIMKPVMFLFQVFGNALNKVTSIFQNVFDTVGSFFTKIGKIFGIDGQKFNANLGKITNILGSILSVIIAWKGISIAKNLLSSAGRGSLSLLKGGIPSKIGTGALSLLSNLPIGIGKNLTPVLSSFTSKLSNVFSAGKFLKVGAIGLGGNLLGNLIKGDAEEGSTKARVGNSISSAASLGSTGAMIGSFIAPGIGTAIGGALGGLVGIITANSDKFNDAFKSIFDSSVFKDLKKGFKEFVEGVSNLFTSLWSGLKEIIIPIVDYAKSIFKTFSFIIKNIWEIISPVLKLIIKNVGTLFSVFGKLGGFAFGEIGKNLSFIGNILVGVGKGIGLLVEVGVKMFGLVIDTFVKPIMTIVSGIKAVSDWLSDIFNSITDFFSVSPWMQNVGSGLLNAIPGGTLLSNMFSNDKDDTQSTLINKTATNAEKIVTNTNNSTTSSVNENLSTIMSPTSMLGNDFWNKLSIMWSKKNDEKDFDIKIAGATMRGGDLPEITKIMEGKKMDMKYAEQGQKENMINSNKVGNPTVNVKVINDSHSMGGLKAKISGN